MRSDALTLAVLAFVAVAAWLVFSIAPGFIFLAAFSDWHFRGCPDAMQCSDAAGTMLVTGGIMAAIGLCVALVVRGLWRRAAGRDA